MTAVSGDARREGARLRADLARSRRRRQLTALLFAAPLLIFLVLSFIAPIATMLVRAVHDPVVGQGLPRTVEALGEWTGEDLPGDPAFAALLEDLAAAPDADVASRVGSRLNYVVPGLRRALAQAGNAASEPAESPAAAREAVLDASPLWSDPASWAAIHQLGRPVTDLHLLKAVDLERSPDGSIVQVPDYLRVGQLLFVRTLWISALVTFCALLLGYPAAYLIASVGPRLAGFLMVLVIVPLWTSLLVRTAAWMALLQRNGVINDTMIALGLIGPDSRLQMVFNAQGTVIAMTHILLPFMILPLVSVMKAVPPDHMRAAESLGASRWLAYRRVYIPSVMPGIAAGCLLVFILSIGYYITPALLGGESGQMIANLIAYHVRESLNWGLAAALSLILLAGVLVLYALHLRLSGDGRIGFGA